MNARNDAVFAATPLILGIVFLTVGIVIHKPGSSKWPLVQGVAIPSGFRATEFEWRSPDGVFCRGRSLAHTIPLRPGNPVSVALDPNDCTRFRLDGAAKARGDYGLGFLRVGHAG
ncbi:hypothetical protein [Arthrobacter sp. PAMC 25486]|uniref:hypothetical protein n=1 Tax=Arthrobacter sp. PAMC 25486 TaxID=1494608 RepID=UPI00056F6BE1|nr:hypothetical protein [Arthrobacter sp. PAMC 25486]